jgi:hypothetical protein
MVWLPEVFPNNQHARETSSKSDKYNCIAWAFGDTTRRWWPNSKGYYWPRGKRPGNSALAEFEAYCADENWEVARDGAVEFGYEKIALYALNGEPKHAARQLINGLWTSKLGDHVDVEHRLSDLEGPQYGNVLRIYRRAKTPAAGR